MYDWNSGLFPKLSAHFRRKTKLGLDLITFSKAGRSWGSPGGSGAGSGGGFMEFTGFPWFPGLRTAEVGGKCVVPGRTDYIKQMDLRQ